MHMVQHTLVRLEVFFNVNEIHGSLDPMFCALSSRVPYVTILRIWLPPSLCQGRPQAGRLHELQCFALIAFCLAWTHFSADDV